MNILWDWNGTLFDDVKISVIAINKVLLDYKLDNISIKEYKDKYRFPIKNYYTDIGFDLNIYKKEQISKKFFLYYNMLIKKQDKNNLNKQKQILEYSKNKGNKNYILSAREHSNLYEEVCFFKMKDFFCQIHGASSSLNKTKEDILINLLKVNEIFKEETILIGDTLSDYELAKKNKINFILFSKGHQSINRFNDTENITLIDSLEKVKKYI